MKLEFFELAALILQLDEGDAIAHPYRDLEYEDVYEDIENEYMKFLAWDHSRPQKTIRLTRMKQWLLETYQPNVELKHLPPGTVFKFDDEEVELLKVKPIRVHEGALMRSIIAYYHKTGEPLFDDGSYRRTDYKIIKD